MNNTRQLTELHKVDITQITNIDITSIGLLEIFGKLTILIQLKNKSIKEFTFVSPVSKQEIVKWLEDNNLLEATRPLDISNMGLSNLQNVSVIGNNSNTISNGDNNNTMGNSVRLNNIEEELRNFIWNDTYMSMNILELTITDKAYYKNEEDL